MVEKGPFQALKVFVLVTKRYFSKGFQQNCLKRPFRFLIISGPDRRRLEPTTGMLIGLVAAASTDVTALLPSLYALHNRLEPEGCQGMVAEQSKYAIIVDASLHRSALSQVSSFMY